MFLLHDFFIKNHFIRTRGSNSVEKQEHAKNLSTQSNSVEKQEQLKVVFFFLALESCRRSGLILTTFCLSNLLHNKNLAFCLKTSTLILM